MKVKDLLIVKYYDLSVVACARTTLVWAFRNVTWFHKSTTPPFAATTVRLNTMIWLQSSAWTVRKSLMNYLT